jgi:polar amino acid transport system substrate-binding protein
MSTANRTRRDPPLALMCLIVIAGMGLSACNTDRSKAARGTTLERIRREGVIRVGYANEAPYAYMDSSTARLTGEAPEIARVIASRMGIEKIEGVLTEFGSLIPGLAARRFDVIAAGMYITPERCKQVAFTNPTYGIGEAFVVKAGNPLDLHRYEDIAAHATARLGVVAGTVEHGYARSVGIPDDRVKVFPDAPSALDGVRTGRVDAFAGTSLTIQDLLSKSRSDQIEQAVPFTDPVIDGQRVIGYGAFVLRKEDTALLAAFNEQLADFIGTEEHLALVKPFGFTEAQLPGDVVATELCGR